jgi:hypothetical protein
MFGDKGATAHDGLGRVLLRRSAPDAVPWPHGAKLLLWTGLAIASWAAVIGAGYFVWSAL